MNHEPLQLPSNFPDLVRDRVVYLLQHPADMDWAAVAHECQARNTNQAECRSSHAQDRREFARATVTGRDRMPPFFTSIKLTKGIGHDRVGFWQGHGKCGELVVDKGTGELLTNLLKIHAEKVFVEAE